MGDSRVIAKIYLASLYAHYINRNRLNNMLKYSKLRRESVYFMQHLAHYVEVIQQADSNPLLHIIKHEQLQSNHQDEDVKILTSTEKFYFNDGTIIQKNTEQDDLATEVEACNECWIQYQVLQQPITLDISPNKIQFNSYCREQYWLKYFK